MTPSIPPDKAVYLPSYLRWLKTWPSFTKQAKAFSMCFFLFLQHFTEIIPSGKTTSNEPTTIITIRRSRGRLLQLRLKRLDSPWIFFVPPVYGPSCYHYPHPAKRTATIIIWERSGGKNITIPFFGSIRFSYGRTCKIYKEYKESFWTYKGGIY